MPRGIYRGFADDDNSDNESVYSVHTESLAQKDTKIVCGGIVDDDSPPGSPLETAIKPTYPYRLKYPPAIKTKFTPHYYDNPPKDIIHTDPELEALERLFNQASPIAQPTSPIKRSSDPECRLEIKFGFFILLAQKLGFIAKPQSKSASESINSEDGSTANGLTIHKPHTI